MRERAFGRLRALALRLAGFLLAALRLAGFLLAVFLLAVLLLAGLLFATLLLVAFLAAFLTLGFLSFSERALAATEPTVRLNTRAIVLLVEVLYILRSVATCAAVQTFAPFLVLAAFFFFGLAFVFLFLL